MATKPKLIDRIEEHYANIGGARGALSEFARDLKLDPRVVHTWSRVRGVIPSEYGDEIEKVTDGAFKATEVFAEDAAYKKTRQTIRLARKKKRVEFGRKRMQEQGAPA